MNVVLQRRLAVGVSRNVVNNVDALLDVRQVR